VFSLCRWPPSARAQTHCEDFSGSVSDLFKAAQMHIKTETKIVQSKSNPKMKAEIVAKDAAKVGEDDLAALEGASDVVQA
jgi:hypothetical protein